MTNLYLLGAGIRGTLQFTRETVQALQACRVVFVLHDDLSVQDYICGLCPDVRDVAELYSPGALRADVYRKIAELVVEEAVASSPVALVVHGHPLFLVSAAEHSLALGRSRGLNVQALSAVSSFDTILTDLEIDYGYAMQMFDATLLLNSMIAPNPAVPMLVFQLTSLLKGEVILEDPGVETLEPLRAHLLRSYPENHECRVVHSAAHVLERSTIIELTIGELASDRRIELWRRPTLYVPART